MTLAFHDMVRSLRTAPIFAFYVLATLVVAGIIGLITFDVINLGMSHFGQLSHRTHDITYGLLFTTFVVGVLAQLRRPDRNVSGMVMALIPPAALVLVGVLSSSVAMQRNPIRYTASLAVVVALVHPAGRDFLRSFSIARVNRLMLALVAVAAVPLIGFASTNISLQETAATDAHGSMGHYGFMAAFSFTVIAVGLLASLRGDGWRLTAWVAAGLPALLGITSILYPDATSRLDWWWALAAVVWGVLFLAAGELTKHAEEAPPPVSQRPVVDTEPLADAR